jgi:hypothetical protein
MAWQLLTPGRGGGCMHRDVSLGVVPAEPGGLLWVSGTHDGPRAV